jgi:hypothetical protein
MGWFLLRGTEGFSYLWDENNPERPKTNSLLKLWNKNFSNTFNGHSRQVFVITCTCHIHWLLSDSLHTLCMSTLDIFCIKPILHRLIQSRIMHRINFRHQLRPHILNPPPIQLLLLTPNKQTTRILKKFMVPLPFPFSSPWVWSAYIFQRKWVLFCCFLLFLSTFYTHALTG